ncbi:TadE/TadG family type IV pilus assembly protein [Erythrobacter aurantius]|uniref:TadE/TadG family type IV pilus assembly protein n=1 Tax=Erythrobacter aurantius TaxID=2909249 RepID=UPI00207A3A73|nr:TadE/TadG family type IV pilus assembly protein [Erythrobacter aurantius]
MKIRSVASSLVDCSRGNALIILSLGLPILIGGAGFATDTAQWYMWRRELQHAVDQAAYAGAWARSNPLAESDYRTRAEQEYAANISKVADFDTAPVIALADYAGGNQNSVLVTSTASKRLPFSSLFMNAPATIRATAQASFSEGLSYNACLIALRDEGNSLKIGGNAEVKARCGLAALSCDDDAIIIDGSADVDTDSIAACGRVSVEDPDLQGVIVENVAGLKDIYADLEPPTNDTPRSYNCTGRGRNKQASLQPGTYSSLVTACDTVLASGIYVIDGGELDLTHNSEVVGNGVMFVLKNGARMKLGGSGSSNEINLTPPTAADLLGYPNADELAGILVFEHRDNNPSGDHILNGNSDSLIEGLIYLPDGNLRINGTADVAAQCLQISAYSIDIRGGAELETLCPLNETTEVGSSIADVRLVA